MRSSLDQVVASPNAKPLAGGNGPLKRPVAASSVGTSAAVSRDVPPAHRLVFTVATYLKLVAGVAGVTGFVLLETRGSRGPTETS